MIENLCRRKRGREGGMLMCRDGSVRVQGRLPPYAGKAPRSVYREGSLLFERDGGAQGRLPPFREGEGWWCAEKAPSVCREGSLLVQGRPLPPVSAVNICQFILIDFHINADSCN